MIIQTKEEIPEFVDLQGNKIKKGIYLERQIGYLGGNLVIVKNPNLITFDEDSPEVQNSSIMYELVGKYLLVVYSASSKEYHINPKTNLIPATSQEIDSHLENLRKKKSWLEEEIKSIEEWK